MKVCCNFYKFFALLIFFCLLNINSYALSPEEHLPNEEQEKRAMNLFLEVRCLVCNGQVIESSNTDFSFKMRKFIRQKIADGYSDQEIKNELIKKFGEDILIEPNSQNKLLLWALPVAFAAVVVLISFRKRIFI